MKWLALVAVLVAGCKTDPPAPAGASASGDQSAARPRSGKVELPAPRPSGGDPGSDSAAPAPAPAPAAQAPDTPVTPATTPPTDDQLASVRHRRAEAIRNRLDTNGDGKLTVDELKGTPAARRIDPDATDTNHDGEISVDELDKMMTSRMGRGMVGHSGFGGVMRGR